MCASDAIYVRSAGAGQVDRAHFISGALRNPGADLGGNAACEPLCLQLPRGTVFCVGLFVASVCS